MADLRQLDRAYAAVNRRFIESGRGPHYTELAEEFELTPDEGRELLHELMNAGIPAWVHPDTDYIVSFAPFNSLPTQYRISVDGTPGWYAQ